MVSPSATNAADEGVRVDALSFCRLECDHDELFLPEYKRSNRTKGLKILRCFPHCCPNHIDRSYCGSSLHVIVQTSGPGSSGSSGPGSSNPGSSRAKPLADSVFLFARFECLSDDGLRVGDTLPAASVVRDTQSEDNAEGTWIPGIKERASALASAMKRVAQAITDHTLVYQLNGKVYSRWYYDWESGANKAQRLMRHVLKAYVFEKMATGSDDSAAATLRVIGVVASPEFTVISYRRAPSEGPPPPAPVPSTSTPTDAVPRDPSPSLGAPKRLSVTADSVDMEQLQSSKRRRRVAPLTLHTATPHELFEDRVLWEHANARLVTVSKNIALVYYFVQWTPLAYYATFVDELVHLVNHAVLEPLVVTAPGHKLDKLNVVARVLLDHAQRNATYRAPPLVLSRELDVLLRAMANAATWFFGDGLRQYTRAFVQQHAASLLDKTALRRAFLQWLVDLEAQLDRDVFAATRLGTLANAAEEIIAAVYTHELFHPKRPVVRQILGEHGFLGWRAFVAQMRDSFIAFAKTPKVSRALPSAAPAHPVERAWSGDWVLDVDESTWKPSVDSTTLSLASVLDLVTQLARVRVTLALDARRLSVASHAAFATDDGMSLVLDGKSRVFRFAPHGWSTAMGDGADGDYIGSTRFEAPDRLIAYVETFRWSRTPGVRSVHVRLRIECWQHERLFVNGEVLETVSSAGLAPDDLQFLPERSIVAKLKMVNRVFLRTPPLPPTSAAASNTPPTAWRRLGGFRLAYARMRR